MAIRFIQKRYGSNTSTAITNDATGRAILPDLPSAAPIAYDQVDNTFKFNANGTIKTLADTGSTQTFSGKTIDSSTITGSTISSSTLSSPVVNGTITGTNRQVKFVTTQFSATTSDTGTTLTNLVGLTGFTLEAGATYRYEIHTSGTANGSGGIKLGFKYTTATLTSLEAAFTGYVAAASATQQTTTATDQATLYAQTAAVLAVEGKGQIVVNAAGTLALQAAQNAANAGATLVYVGSYMVLERIS